MSKKGKGKGKKGDEELEEEIRQNLKFDIETLENNIHLEKVRELNAINDYNQLLEGTKLQQKTIDELKEAEGTKLSSKNASLKKEEESNYNSLNVLEMEIRKLDIDIEDLEKKIEDKKKVLFAAFEATPFIKTGGLGDVAGEQEYILLHLADRTPDLLPVH